MCKLLIYIMCLYVFVILPSLVFGQTPLVSTRVNEALKRQLGNDGKWISLEFSDGSTQSTASFGGDVVGPASSVDSEIAIYNSTTGKLLKRFAGTGILTATSGVIGTATTTGTGDVVLATSPTVKTPTVSDGAIFNLLSNNNITIDASTNPRTVTTGVVRINHTPGMVGTRPFTLNIDAAGFGDTHAISTDFTATGIGAGEQSHLFDINVNTANSTGGEVNGFVMAKTGTGAVDCNAVEVYPGVDVIDQRTGVETSIEQAFAYNGAYTDITSNLSSAASDVQLFVANGDIVYIGNAGTFNSLAVTLAVAASGAGIKPTFEYSAGASSWTAFSPTDGTNGFRNLGGTIAWGTLTGWATDTVNAVGSKYWIRITRTQNTLATPPTEDLIKYIASVNYGWDKDGDISAATFNGLTCAAQTNGFTIAGGTTSKTLTVPLDASVSGTNTGDNATNSQYSSLVSNATHTGDATGSTALTVVGINGTLMSGLATGIVKNTTTTGVPSIAVAGDFPTLNQSTTGTAANVTGIVEVVNGGSGTNTATGTGAIVLKNSPVFSTQITTPSIISAGALGITPASGSNVNVDLGGTGDFAVNTSQLYVDTSSGYLGVGTSTPSTKLTVGDGLSSVGNYWVSSVYLSHGISVCGTDANEVGTAHFEGNRTTADTTVGAITFRNTQSSRTQEDKTIAFILASTPDSYDAEAGILKFGTHDTGSGLSTRMVINEIGNVGIGTSTPSAQLHTTGSVRFQNFGAGAATFDADGNVSSASDERYKDIAGVFTAGLNQVLGIQPIKYRWNALSGLEKDNVYTGFSAQNVRKFIPEAVSVDAQGYYNLQDRVLIAALVNAVKQLTLEMDVMRGKLGLLPLNRLGIDRSADSTSVVKSKVAQREKECSGDEVIKEAREVVENIDGVDVVKMVEALKAGIVEKDKKFFRQENIEEATQRYRLISQEPQQEGVVK